MAIKKSGVTPPGVEKSGTRESEGETAQAPVNVGERQPEGEVFTPRVTVASRGKISQTLEGVANAYRKKFPDRDCRWVFHSVRKPELSNVMSRNAEGYSLVKAEDLKDTEVPIGNFVDAEGLIRVADVVLMGIPAGQRAVNARERQRLADAQINRVSDAFNAAMESVKQGSHRSEARGAVKMQVKEHNLDYEQPSKE
jgi:hypothetical protein